MVLLEKRKSSSFSGVFSCDALLLRLPWLKEAFLWPNESGRAVAQRPNAGWKRDGGMVTARTINPGS
jgi:hypothetical protein